MEKFIKRKLIFFTLMIAMSTCISFRSIADDDDKLTNLNHEYDILFDRFYNAYQQNGRYLCCSSYDCNQTDKPEYPPTAPLPPGSKPPNRRGANKCPETHKDFFAISDDGIPKCSDCSTPDPNNRKIFEMGVYRINDGGIFTQDWKPKTDTLLSLIKRMDSLQFILNEFDFKVTDQLLSASYYKLALRPNLLDTNQSQSKEIQSVIAQYGSVENAYNRSVELENGLLDLLKKTVELQTAVKNSDIALKKLCDSILTNAEQFYVK